MFKIITYGFIVAPCILNIHWVLHTNKCNNYILCISLKFFTLTHLKCSYMFWSLVHPQGARIVPCWRYMLKLWICRYIYQWCDSISCVCVCVVFSTGGYVDWLQFELGRVKRIHKHTICCHITDKYNDIFTILTCNFSKEQYVLPEDDLRIEICRSILSVLM